MRLGLGLGRLRRVSIAVLETVSSIGAWFATRAFTSDNLYAEDDIGQGSERTVQPGRAYNFDGSDDYVEKASGVVTAYPMTVALWARATATADYYVFSTGDLSSTSQNLGILFRSNGFISVRIADGSTTVIDSTFSYAIDTWYRIVVVLNDADTRTVYIDGVAYAATGTGHNFPTGVDYTTIGALGRSAAYQNTLSGRICDAQVWNAAWDADDVTYDYLNKTKLAFDRSGTSLTSSNLKILWKGDDNHATTAYDSSGNSNDGTKTSITAATFHHEGNDVPISYQNDVGYTDDSGDLVPRDESDTTKDVAGNALEYSGVAPRNAKLEGSNTGTLDGVDDHIIVTDDASLATSGDITVSAWFRHTDAAQHGAIIQREPVNSTWGIYLQTTTPFLMWRGGSSTSLTITSDIASLTNVWHHVLVTQTGTTATAYLNGVQVATGTVDAIGNSGDIHIGNYATATSSWHFVGQISDARVYNSVLSAADISAVYNNQATSVSPILHIPVSDGVGGIAHDVSGNNNHGVITNTTLSTFWGTKQDVFHHNITKGFDQAGEFDGSDDYVDCGTVNPTGSATIACWARFNAAPSVDYRLVCSRDGSSNGIDLHVLANGQAVHFNGVNVSSASSAVAFDGTWHHIAVVIDGASSQMYINGVASGSTADTTLVASASTLYIGKYRPSSIRHMGGSMRDVRIYNSALSASEISDLYSGTVVSTTPFSKYLFNEGNGTNIADGGSNASDGTATNITEADFWASKRPARAGELSIFGGPVSNQPGKWHNNAETTIDFTGNVLAPWTQQVELGHTNFDGDNDAIYIGSITSGHVLMLNGSAGTIGCWIRTESGADTYARIVDKSTGGGGAGGYYFSLKSTDRGLAFGAGGSNNYETDSGTLWDHGTWTHVAVAWDSGGTPIMYVNGVAVAGSFTTPPAAALPNTTADLRIGTWNHTTGREFKGDMKGLRIYNSQLSAAQILGWYGGNIPANPVGEWKLCGNAIDTSGNNNNGKLENVTLADFFPKLTVPTAYAFGDAVTDPMKKRVLSITKEDRFEIEDRCTT